RLVHRDERVAEAANSLLVAQRLPERLPEHDGGVLDGVVRLDLDVAHGPHGQVEAGVRAQRGEHVVVERHAGADVGAAGAVELDDVAGFPGDAFYARGPVVLGHFVPRSSLETAAPAISSAASSALTRRNSSFSAARPMVARRCPAMPTSRMSTP